MLYTEQRTAPTENTAYPAGMWHPASHPRRFPRRPHRIAGRSSPADVHGYGDVRDRRRRRTQGSEKVSQP